MWMPRYHVIYPTLSCQWQSYVSWPSFSPSSLSLLFPPSNLLKTSFHTHRLRFSCLFLLVSVSICTLSQSLSLSRRRVRFGLGYAGESSPSTNVARLFTLIVWKMLESNTSATSQAGERANGSHQGPVCFGWRGLQTNRRWHIRGRTR